ncbi:MAG: SCO family protein [Verrucomicrobiota bacterium]
MLIRHVGAADKTAPDVMQSTSRHLNWTVWGGLVLTVLVIAAAFISSRLQSGSSRLPVLWQVQDFSLTNQSGAVVSLSDLRGSVWVADIIFTRCPGPCAFMTKRMAELQGALPPDSPVKLVSLTTDPEFDSPKVLQDYARRFGARDERWQFLTGTKQAIFDLAVRDLKLALQELPPDKRTVPNDLFLHSTRFVLVDKQGRVRGVFDMLPEVTPADEPPDSEAVKASHEAQMKAQQQALLQAIATLAKE